jgi:hypothetical protein
VCFIFLFLAAFLFVERTVISGELLLSENIRYYKGVHKVKLLTKSEGYWIVEALEDFDDFVDSQIIRVKAGEQRIVPASMLSLRMHLEPPIREHAYELNMEKKVKRMIEKEERQKKESQPPQH